MKQSASSSDVHVPLYCDGRKTGSGLAGRPAMACSHRAMKATQQHGGNVQHPSCEVSCIGLFSTQRQNLEAILMSLRKWHCCPGPLTSPTWLAADRQILAILQRDGLSPPKRAAGRPTIAVAQTSDRVRIRSSRVN